jgi:serine/threonine protein phosphatase 1
MADLIQTFAANAAGRDFVVGDIHGCFYQLDALLERIGFERGCDRLFSVGDLIDRGPDSERAADFIDAPWFHAVRGNHEQMMLDAVAKGGDAEWLWHINGGDWFESLHGAQRQRLLERAAALPYAIEIAVDANTRAGLVHAQMPAMPWPALRHALQGERVDTTLVNTLLWERDSANAIERRRTGARPGLAVAAAGVDVVFHGHTPMPRPIACANTRWLDTGAFMDGPLSIAELAVDGAVWSLTASSGRLEAGWQWLADAR